MYRERTSKLFHAIFGLRKRITCMEWGDWAGRFYFIMQICIFVLSRIAKYLYLLVFFFQKSLLKFSHKIPHRYFL